MWRPGLLAGGLAVDHDAPALPAEPAKYAATPPHGRGVYRVAAPRHGPDPPAHHPFARGGVAPGPPAEEIHTPPSARAATIFIRAYKNINGGNAGNVTVPYPTSRCRRTRQTRHFANLELSVVRSELPCYAAGCCFYMLFFGRGSRCQAKSSESEVTSRSAAILQRVILFSWSPTTTTATMPQSCPWTTHDASSSVAQEVGNLRRSPICEIRTRITWSRSSPKTCRCRTS